MKKLALVVASVAAMGFATPSFASDDSAGHARIQLAQLGVSVNVGDGPRARTGVVVRERHRHHRHYRHHHHRAQADVVVVKKRKPARRTVIIER